MTITLNGTNGITTPEVVLDNTAADGGQVVLKSSGYSDWNLDNYSGRLRAYYGGTEYFTVNSSGNIGIGNSSPQFRLEADQNSASSTPSKNAAIQVYTRGYGGSATYYGGIGFAMHEHTNGYWGSGIQALDDTGSYGSALTFSTSTGSATPTPIERMRIDSSGNLLVGTTTQRGKVTADIGAASSVCFDGSFNTGNGQAGAFRSNYTNPSGTAYHAIFAYNGGIAGVIISTSTTTSYVTSSDYRLKENIQPMQNALGVVQQLKPVTYTWKSDGSDGQGFIAHELQAVVPDCVTGEKDAVDAEGKPVYQGIDTSFLVATLTKAIQEQQEQIEQLKSEVAALKGVAQ